MSATTARTTLLAALWPTQSGSAILRAAILALVGSLLLTVSAKVQVPFWPVPMTMQTYVVLVLGMAFGVRLGVATIGLYLLEGALGLAVFAGTPERGVGIPYMLGPTGGYLLGFLLAGAMVGWLAERGWDRNLVKSAIAMTAGHILIFIPGIFWLAAHVGLGKAFALGFVPFIWATILKTALGVATMPVAWRLLQSFKSP
jgi:biotin transport system substrate-specific component